MSKFNDPDFRKQLSSIFIKIADKIEQDEEFASFLFQDISIVLSDQKIKSKSIVNQPNKIEKHPLPDIFTMYVKDGVDSLRDHLNQFESETLKQIVLENGLDPASKVRRWKSKDRILTFILEVVSKQMSKGNAFLDESAR